jgi:hypothetical protein
MHVRAVDLDAIDQAELDEVESQLGIDDVGQRGFDIVNGGHGSSVEPAIGGTFRVHLWLALRHRLLRRTSLPPVGLGR